MRTIDLTGVTSSGLRSEAGETTAEQERQIRCYGPTSPLRRACKRCCASRRNDILTFDLASGTISMFTGRHFDHVNKSIQLFVHDIVSFVLLNSFLIDASKTLARDLSYCPIGSQ